MNYKIKPEVNQELWDYIIEDEYQGYKKITNEVFEIIPDTDIKESGKDYNFYHIPSGVKIKWDKHPLRNAVCNQELSYEQFRNILYDCMNYTHSNYIKQITEWWKN